MRWHAEPSAFEKECVGYPGFVTKFRISNQVNQMESNETETTPFDCTYIIKNAFENLQLL